MCRDFFMMLDLMIMNQIARFKKEEKGDTNFISILIILGVVILLAGVFIKFKGEIVKQVQDIIDGFTIS